MNFRRGDTGSAVKTRESQTLVLIMSLSYVYILVYQFIFDTWHSIAHTVHQLLIQQVLFHLLPLKHIH